MERPRVVMSVGASVDGKVTLTREQTLTAQPSGQVWADMVPAAADRLRADLLDLVRQHYGCNATLEGSGSLVADGVEPASLPAYEGDPAEPYSDFLPDEIIDQLTPRHMWFVAVDGRGRVRWTERHPGWEVLVLVCRRTPVDYLAYLRRERICYLMAGQDRVDLTEALSGMATRLGIRCVLSTAGGGLNGALLRAGLIDELSLTVAPALVGGLGTPSVLDGLPLAVGDHPTSLRLLSVHVDASGSVQLRYEVIRAEARSWSALPWAAATLERREDSKPERSRPPDRGLSR